MKKFTLIELLFVVAIVGILVTLLLPSLANAREKSRIAVCLSNQRQVAAAYNMYTVQNNTITAPSRWYNTWAGPQGFHNWAADLAQERPLNLYLGENRNRGDFKGLTVGGAVTDAIAANRARSYNVVAWCPSDKGETGNVAGNHMGRNFGASYQTETIDWKIRWLSIFTGSMPNSGGSANVVLRITKFDRPDMKALYHPTYFRPDRNWYTAPNRERFLWHDQKLPKHPTAFADGHAVYYNHWMKLLNNGWGADPATTAGYSSGNMTTALPWRWANLELY